MLPDVAARLRRAIEQRGWTIRVLASKAGVPDEVVWDFSQGRSWPDPASAGRIARALDMHPADLAPPPPRRTERPFRPSPSRDSLGLPILAGEVVEAIRAAPSRWRQKEIRRIERRQETLVRLLVDSGVFTQKEWEEKLSHVIRKRKARRAHPLS